MVMPLPTSEPIAIAILAKAPVPGFAKTRLIPALGADGAATLQARLIERAVMLVADAEVGPATLWAAPDASHPVFTALADRGLVTLARQPAGDLGARMLAAIVAARGPALVIGTDCPAMTVGHLRAAAETLRGRTDAVVIPTDDGGYALIGMRCPTGATFSDMPWGTSSVMAETRRRLEASRLTWGELETIWDVDVTDDLTRLHAAGLGGLLAVPGPL